MTHLGVFPVLGVPAGGLPADDTADPGGVVQQNVFWTEIGVGELQLVWFSGGASYMDILFGKIFDRMAASLELLERFHRVERADAGVSEAVVQGTAHLKGWKTDLDCDNFKLP